MRRKKREPAGITGVWEPFDGKLKVGYKYQTQGRRVVLIVDPDEREAFNVFMFVIEGVEKTMVSVTTTASARVINTQFTNPMVYTPTETRTSQ